MKGCSVYGALLPSISDAHAQGVVHSYDGTGVPFRGRPVLNAIRRAPRFFFARLRTDSRYASLYQSFFMANKNLNAAKVAKKDEFYTQLEDIERELQHYWQHFRGKTVLCNCDVWGTKRRGWEGDGGEVVEETGVQRVGRTEGRWVCKTIGLHWFNLGLIFWGFRGGLGLHWFTCGRL